MFVLGDDDTCAYVSNNTADQNEDMHNSDEHSVETDAPDVTVEVRRVKAESFVEDIVNVNTRAENVDAGIVKVDLLEVEHVWRKVAKVDRGTWYTESCIHYFTSEVKCHES